MIVMYKKTQDDKIVDVCDTRHCHSRRGGTSILKK